MQLMRGKDPGAASARSYLASRGFGGEVPKRWELGFAPGSGQLVRHLKAKGFKDKELVDANVALDGGRDGRRGGLKDRFYNRVMFPIFDVQGDCIAFGGRIIGDGQPKYLNSQETPVFHKSEVLFGLDKAKTSMAATGVSALIVALSYNCSPDVFAGMSCPVIQVDRQSPSLPYSSIRLNNRKGGYLAARHLIELGHRRIACITGPRWLMSSQERESGYRWAMEEAGIPVTGDMVIEGDYLSTGGYALADSVIAGGFTAVFCENDMTAIGLYRRFRERGITVGQDISVVGFDDISFCEMLDTPLTTIRQSGYDIGYEACSRAMQEIANPELPHQSIYFEPRLIKRESARACRKGSTL